jgi:integrase/recombinase XerC
MTRQPQRKRKKRAILGVLDLRAIRAAAKDLGPRESAVIEWLYTNGQRASEPGLARLSDLDMHTGTVSLTHLKGGLDPEPMPMSERCREALRAWLPLRAFKSPEQEPYVFPSANPHTCYPCKGARQMTMKSRKTGEARVVPCPHCHATGTRWGMTRHEIRHIVAAVFTKAGIPKEFHFAHVLRHSAVTHLLDSGVKPPAIQERVGHKELATTFGYMHTTKEAREAVTKAFDEEEDT